MGALKLGQVFDRRNNALNAWRLTLALGVIVWHAYPLTGRTVSYEPVHQLLRDAWVDGFFAISGFLITASWFSNPRMRTYFAARGLRLLPGLWVCLIITAFVVAPIGVAMQGGAAGRLLLSFAPIEYVLKNSAVAILQPAVGERHLASHGRTGGTVRCGLCSGSCSATSALLLPASSDSSPAGG